MREGHAEMTLTAEPPTSAGEDSLRGALTSPLRIYAADHQPIRLLAELEGTSPAELVHRALRVYLNERKDELGSRATLARDFVRSGDFPGLAQLFSDSNRTRRRNRAARLGALNEPQS